MSRESNDAAFPKRDNVATQLHAVFSKHDNVATQGQTSVRRTLPYRIAKKHHKIPAKRATHSAALSFRRAVAQF